MRANVSLCPSGIGHPALNEADHQTHNAWKGTGMHDAASVVAGMAGLTEPKQDVTPAQLAARFCGDNIDDAVKLGRGTKSSGFCGYIGGRGDSMLTGFDDGYDMMGYLEEHGWKALAGKGDWPYVVYMAYAKREPYAIVEYCECDFTVWTFPNGHAAQAFYRTLKDCP